MKVSYNWLKEFVDIDVNAYDLADKLTLSGLEVESVFDIQKACFDSVVGKILSKEPICNNLYLLVVDTGNQQSNIVTSDNSLKIDNKVGVVLAGSYFNNNLVKEKKFCNVVSEGFLLSASEIGIEESSNSVLLLDDEFVVGTYLRDIDAFKDYIFDISITPNRADCLSILGIAREVSIYYNKPIKLKDCKVIKEDNNFSVTLDNDCPSYIASIMNVKLGQSCFDMRLKLIKSGERPINNILKLSTESSYRFERGIDPNLNEYATYYAIDLLQQYANANVIGITKNISKKEPKGIEFDIDEINKFLGSNYNKSKFYEIGFDVEETPVGLVATIPTYRIDIESMEDIAEEIARIEGYDKLPSTIPCVKLNLNTNINTKDHIREVLKLSGLSEVINYSFVDGELLSKLNKNKSLLYIKNPLTKEQNCMRNTLFLGLMDNLVFNLNHNIKSIALFEIGRIFDINQEYDALGIIMHGFKPLNWYTQKITFDFYDIKGAFESIFGLFDCNIEFRKEESYLLHPKKSLTIYNDGRYIGFMGEIHPDIYDLFDIKFSKSNIFYGEILIDSFNKFRSFYFKPLPKFPIVVRDLNIVVEKSENVDHIKNAISSFDFVYNVNLIDRYDLGSKKSLNFRIELYSANKTLTDSDIEQLINEIFSKLSSEFKATIRGG